MGPHQPFAGCEALAAMLGMTGVGVSLCGQPMHASDTVVGTAEARQFVLGEGPMIDAFERREPVEAPNLADANDLGWLARILGARSGIHAAYAIPLFVSHACIGAMTVYREETGELADSFRSMLHVAADCTAVEAAELLVASRATRQRNASMRRVDELHQAVGVVMRDVSAPARMKASTRLRAHVFQSDCSLDQVVAGLRDHSLRLADDRDGAPATA